VEGDDVGGGQQRMERDLLGGRADSFRVGAEHAQAVGRGARGDRGPDPPAADDAERQLGQPPQLARRAVVPLAGAHRAVEHDDAAQQREHQGDRMVGDLLGAVVGDVDDPHAARGRRLEVDGVHPHAVADHGAAARHAVKQRAVDGRVLHDQHVGVAAAADPQLDARRLEQLALGLERAVVAVGDEHGRHD
jgi:hypothetical protein